MNQLPVTAQQFIKQHFADRKVALPKVETEFVSKSYEVVFADGDHIDFDSKGNWKEIECKSSSVPTAVIPIKNMEYIHENYPDTTVRKIEKDLREYEVKLSNCVELSFDLKFNLKDIDM
ncbi:MAG: PepSY-like domain-containing protein [Bacteroidaceae bacterium]|nr:PepSY-like domain-containing protein [Bacteroidaceae bacterium]